MIVLIGKLACSPFRLGTGTMYMWRYPLWLNAELTAVYLHFWYQSSKTYHVHCSGTMIVDLLRSLRYSAIRKTVELLGRRSCLDQAFECGLDRRNVSRSFGDTLSHNSIPVMQSVQ